MAKTESGVRARSDNPRARGPAPDFRRVQLPPRWNRRPRPTRHAKHFIDQGWTAVHLNFRQIDRAHRDFTDEQIEFLANIVRLYRGQPPEFAASANELFSERFPDGSYTDVNGLCRVATVTEIESRGWSLNPGRYVGTEVEDLEDEVFDEKLAAAYLELRELAARAAELEASVDGVLTQLPSR